MERDDWRAGQRVKIRSDPEYGPGPWPDEPRGVIRRHPEAAPGEVSVTTETLVGTRRTYWIAFDLPQFDTDGGGPYSVSEVLETYIEAED